MMRYSISVLIVLLAACSAKPESERFQLARDGASFPTTAVDDAGTAYAAWFARTADGGDVIRVARGSEPPVDLDPGRHLVNVHPQAPAQVATGPGGALYVAWTSTILIEGRRFPASDVLLSRSVDGGRAFEPPVLVNDDAGGLPAGHTFHDVTVGPDGVVYVSWLDSREGGPDEHAHAESMAHPESSDTEVRVARSLDGGRSFEASVVVASGTCQCCRTSLAASETAVLVGWRHIYGSNVRDVAVARSEDGGRSFSAPVRVHEDGWAVDGCPHNGPSLTIGPGDEVYVAWYTAAEGGIGLYRAVSGDGGRSFGASRTYQRNVSSATARIAATEDGVWNVWEMPGSREIRVSGGHEASFTGSAPSIAAYGSVVSVVWMHDGGIEAYRVTGS